MVTRTLNDVHLVALESCLVLLDCTTVVVHMSLQAEVLWFIEEFFAAFLRHPRRLTAKEIKLKRSDETFAANLVIFR